MRLLIVEDEKEICDTVAKSLYHAGYEVDTCYDGEEALECILIENYDLVVLDLNLPGMDGMEILKELRQSNEETKVLILSARGQIADKVEGLDLGANDYLTKPFAAKELLARIRTMIRTQTTQTESILYVGNITLNRATFELTSPTGSFRLANKEFQMMEVFLCNQGHSITHKRLLEKIWGDEKQVQTNVVWMYISYLRKKLEVLHANLQITEASHAEYILEVGG